METDPTVLHQVESWESWLGEGRVMWYQEPVNSKREKDTSYFICREHIPQDRMEFDSFVPVAKSKQDVRSWDLFHLTNALFILTSSWLLQKK